MLLTYSIARRRLAPLVAIDLLAGLGSADAAGKQTVTVYTALQAEQLPVY